MESIDWASVLQDTALIAGVSTAIAFVIDFLKKLYYKIPWGWVQKTPGEVWFALSIALGLGFALFVLWPTLVSGEGSVFDQIQAAVYGLVFGAGSKFIHSVSSSAGAKLQASKLENKAKTDAMTQGKGYIASGTGATALTNIQPQPVVEESCATPIMEYSTTQIVEPPKTQNALSQIDIKDGIIEDGKVYKEVVIPDGYYVLIDGVIHKLKGTK